MSSNRKTGPDQSVIDSTVVEKQLNGFLQSNSTNFLPMKKQEEHLMLARDKLNAHQYPRQVRIHETRKHQPQHQYHHQVAE